MPLKYFLYKDCGAEVYNKVHGPLGLGLRAFGLAGGVKFLGSLGFRVWGLGSLRVSGLGFGT